MILTKNTASGIAVIKLKREELAMDKKQIEYVSSIDPKIPNSRFFFDTYMILGSGGCSTSGCIFMNVLVKQNTQTDVTMITVIMEKKMMAK